MKIEPINVDHNNSAYVICSMYSYVYKKKYLMILVWTGDI